jgi:predicted  nucleic acid-binding Zn-ribbon protein
VIDTLRHLMGLQRIDDEIARLRADQAAIPMRRAELDASREAAEGRVLEARQALEAAEGAQRQAEVQLQDREALRRKLEGQQFQVKTNDAYTALLHEIERAREAISSCETAILEAMDSIETSKSARRAAEEAVRGVSERAARQSEELDQREAALTARAGELDLARREAVEKIPAELLAQYDKISARHRPAVVRVRQETCQGCRVHIPPQLVVELIRGTKVLSCTHCQRILVPESVADPAPK